MDRSPRSSSLPFVFVFVLCVGAGLAAYYALNRRAAPPVVDVPEPAIVPTGDYRADERARVQLFKDVKDSVVNVDTLAIQRGYDYGLIERQQGTGSGIVWNDVGHIVTNFHVIQEAVRNRDLTVRVRLADRSSWNARLVDAAPDYDLAVLQIDAPKDRLKPIKRGTSSDLEVGKDVFAIGNPFGQNLTFTRGIISSLDREIQSPTDQPIRGVIQTDAALNPGNSGGPLLDWDGRLIGVNTAIATPNGGNIGIGFAIPVDTVREVVPQLIRNSRPVKPTLGMVPLREQFTRDLGFERGVMVADVRPEGPAAKAKLLPMRRHPSGRWILGDLILGIEQESINGVRDLDRVLAKYQVGQTIKLTIQRNDELIEVNVVLEGA